MSDLSDHEIIILEILKEREIPLTFIEIYNIFKDKRKSSFVDKLPKKDYFRSIVRKLITLGYVNLEYIEGIKHSNGLPIKHYSINKNKSSNIKE